MKISGDWIAEPGTQKLCKALEDAGYRALFVGGCVRNALLDVAVADIDIATDALPETVSDIAEKAGFRVEFEDTARSAGRDTLSSGWYMRRG